IPRHSVDNPARFPNMTLKNASGEQPSAMTNLNKLKFMEGLLLQDSTPNTWKTGKRKFSVPFCYQGGIGYESATPEIIFDRVPIVAAMPQNRHTFKCPRGILDRGWCALGSQDCLGQPRTDHSGQRSM